MSDASLDPRDPQHELLMAIGSHIGWMFGAALDAGEPGDPAEISDEGIARLVREHKITDATLQAIQTRLEEEEFFAAGWRVARDHVLATLQEFAE